MAGIYFHIPFCKQACHYCDFHFSTNTSIRETLIGCMVDELRLQRDYLGGEKISTIYFGGGTPSMLDILELKKILAATTDHFEIEDHAEITLEANPDDLNVVKLKALRLAGFNRLSIGIQSFHDSVLQFLNRAHDSASARESVEQARAAGFDNISIDLIYAIPGQTDDQWMEDIEHAIALQPEHISAYSLTIEEKTVFGRWSSKGKLTPVDDDHAARQMELLVDTLERAGYEQYEVSNFARPGFYSRHNSNYWRQQKYLGIGPSAHSYNLVSRQFNIANNHLYVKSIAAGNVPFEFDRLSPHDHVNEYLLTTLRTSWGASLDELNDRFRYDILTTHKGLIDDLKSKGLAVIEDRHLRLTRGGKLFADKISSELFLLD